MQVLITDYTEEKVRYQRIARELGFSVDFAIAFSSGVGRGVGIVLKQTPHNQPDQG